MPQEIIHIHRHEPIEVKVNFVGLENLFGNQFSQILNQLNTIMAKQDELNAALAEISDATTAISARLQTLIDGGADNVTEESLQALQADADALKAIGTPA